MAAKRKTKAREAQLAFEALSIEGGLLSPEWLSKVAQLQASTQSDADYRLLKGLNLRDEIGRYWRIAQAHWADFKSGCAANPNAKAIADRFVLALLRDAFGFTALVPVEPAVLQERAYPIGHATLGGRVPVVIAPAGIGLDMLSPAFGDGARRRSAFGLVQEYLNAHEGALWGITSDGANLRIVRDNASLTRPAWIEADLQRIFTEERYADFAALWLLGHETRFGREGQPVTEGALETWRSAGREEGTRAREHLRRGVEDALVALGQGFLSHAENASLRADLQNGTMAVKDYFNQLLRLVYRLIFLLTVEERGLLHPDGTSEATKALYANGYGIRRLRERSVKRSAHDRFADLWDATKVVSRGLAGGESRLGLPALAGIFAANQCPALDAAKLENRALLLAVFKLAWLREDGRLARVNWRDMGPEELGSVYESLLELVPQIAKDGRQFAFATGGETKGNARKTTGSYYTPDSLVQVLLDSALEPVIADTIARNPDNTVQALLGLSIVDPACGSGHFLLAAARRLAAYVARLQANGTPSAAEYRQALRQVVGRCIFGVDLNPMAVELCKVGLWMEAVEPGLPLTFLNSHIQHGNALLGTTPELMAKGIPDAAWDPIEGDDKKTASALKKRNKKHSVEEQTAMSFVVPTTQNEAQVVTRAVSELDAASDANVEALAKKEERWDGILGSLEYRHQKFVADAWCAAFVWPKQPGELTDAAPTNELWRQLRDSRGKAPALTTNTVGELADQYRFFHWHLQFPQVFAKGGFDVVLGNPPWEQVEFKAREFFASRNEAVARASTAAQQKKLIADMARTDPTMFAQYEHEERRASAMRSFLVGSVRFPFCGHGRVNLFTLFAEAGVALLARERASRAGLLLPSGIATDESAKDFFASVVASARLVSLTDFINGNAFTAVHSAFRFCLFCCAGCAWGGEASYAFGLTSVQERESHAFRLSSEAFATLNPNTRTCPVFNSPRDARLTLEIHGRAHALWLETEAEGGNWALQTMSMPNVADDSAEFRTSAQLGNLGFKHEGPFFIRSQEHFVRFYEAKMFTLWEHRAADVIVSETAGTRLGQPSAIEDDELRTATRLAMPRHWFPEVRLTDIVDGKWTRKWFVGWRDITSALNERTLVPAVLPWAAFGRNNIPPLWPGASTKHVACLVAGLSSYVLDYVARQKLGGLHMTVSLMRQLPVHSPMFFDASSPWGSSQALTDFIVPRVIELAYTAWDLEPFARDLGYLGTPFRWDGERRFQLRCELDAAFFHLYRLSRDDVDYVMDTFPIVRKNDEKAHGEYRTKRVILETYDAFVKASRTGKPYRTPIEPPPASPGASHGVFAADGTPKDYAEALRAGLLFTLICRSGEAGISQGTLSRALLWLEDAKHAANGFQGGAFADFERVLASDPLLSQGASEAPKLLQALENEKVITRDAKGIVRLRAGSAIPNWLPQTPTLAKLTSVMRTGLEQADAGASATPAVEKAPTGKVKRA